MDLLETRAAAKRHPWEQARFEIINGLVEPHILPKKELCILDIGCGDLYFLNRFSKLYPEYHYYAVDTAFEEKEVGSSKHAKILKFRSLKAIPHGIQFHVIFLLDVIEHVQEDKHFLRDLVQSPLVTKDTLFIITAPAFQSLFSSYDHFLGHYRRYTNASLEEVTKHAGLCTLSIGYFFFSLLLIRSFEVFKEKCSPNKEPAKGTKLSTWDKNDFTTLMVKQILLIDYKFHVILKKIHLPTPGLSNYIVCRRHV